MGSSARRVGGIGLAACLAAASALLAPLPALATEGTTVRVAEASNPWTGPVISSDGNAVVYALDPGDPQPAGLPPASGTQLYLRDVAAGTTERVSVGTDGTPAVGEENYDYDVDRDGSHVAFTTDDSGLAPAPDGDCECSDVFVRDRTANGGQGATYRVSLAWDGSAPDGNSGVQQIGDDGDRIVFLSYATNLVEGDSTDLPDTVDVFVRDLPDGPTRRLSDPDLRSQGLDGKAPLPPFALSADGSTVAWLAFTPDDEGVLVVDDLDGGARTVLPGVTNPFRPTLSGNGRLVGFVSIDQLAVQDVDTDEDGYLFDRDALPDQAVSLLTTNAAGDQPSGFSWATEISDDGTFALLIGAGGLEPDGVVVPDGALVIYRRNLVTDDIDVVNVGVDGSVAADGASPWTRSMSADGRHVVFLSTAANLVAGGDGAQAVYLRTFTSSPPPGTIDTQLTGDPVTVTTGAPLPVQLSIEVPSGVIGRLTATPQPVTSGDTPTGYSLFDTFDTTLVIEGPDAPVGSFYELTFRVEAAVLGDVAPEDVQIFRDGVALPDCSAAVQEPCVVSRTTDDLAAVVTVRTPGFSRWAVGRLSYSVSGPFGPVDSLPAVNRVKAGSAVPVTFALGGDRGRDVFADGYPRTTTAGCAGQSDEIEQTVSPGSVTLSFDARSGRYTYVWKTAKGTTGCRNLVLRFRDGSELTARFQLR
jgi:hypothetical protein